MKKLFMAVAFLLVTGLAYASPHWFPRQYYDTDQIITSSSTMLYDVSIYWSGATAGDTLNLRNGTAVTSTSFLTFKVATAAGWMSYQPPQPLTIDGGIYLDVDKTAGIMGINLLYQ